MKLLLKYRFFILCGLYILLQIYDRTEFATIVFFILILDLANSMNQNEG